MYKIEQILNKHNKYCSKLIINTKLQNSKLLIVLMKVLLLISVLLLQIVASNSLSSQCGISNCSRCDAKSKACYACDLPYKPTYKNQSICSRCSNNCQVCAQPGNDSKGVCLSCEQNFDFGADPYCASFYLWINAVVIASYIVFAIICIIIFCFIKRRKQNKQNFWFQNLELYYNKMDSSAVTKQKFDQSCQKIVNFLQQASNTKTLKFKDRYFQKQMNLSSIKLSNVKGQIYIKSLSLEGCDTSNWSGSGFILVCQNSSSPVRLWFAKTYHNKVYSQQISKVIVYESSLVDLNKEIRGKWFYYQRPDISGLWIAAIQV